MLWTLIPNGPASMFVERRAAGIMGCPTKPWP